jgi:hypothetical protein
MSKTPEGLPGEGNKKESLSLPLNISKTEKEIAELSRENSGDKNVEKTIDSLKESIRGADSPESVEVISPEERSQLIKKYQEKYLPDHIKEKPGAVTGIMRYFATFFAKFETQGSENIPEKGPFLVVSNHFGDEGNALLKTFKDYDIHIATGRKIWWEKSKILQWFFKKMRVLPVQESLANLSREEKEAALKRQGSWGQKVFRKIIDREDRGEFPVDVEFIRGAVAALSRGDSVSIFLKDCGLIRKVQHFNQEKKPN